MTNADFEAIKYETDTIVAVGEETEEYASYPEHELDVYLGESVDEYDTAAIIEEATEFIFCLGNRYWKADIDLDEICQRHRIGGEDGR